MKQKITPERLQQLAEGKKLSYAKSQQRILANVKKIKRFDYDALLCDDDEYSTYSLRQRVKTLTTENRRLREFLSKIIEAYEKVFSNVNLVKTVLDDARRYVIMGEPDEPDVSHSSMKDDERVIFDEIVPCVSEDLLETETISDNHLLTEEFEKQSGAMDKLEDENVQEDFTVIRAFDNESHQLSEIETKVDIQNEVESTTKPETEQNNETEEDIITLDPRVLHKCNASSLSHYVGDLVSLLYSSDELATSSITGKISNIHRNRLDGIRVKKPLNKRKLQLLYECVGKKFPNYDKKKVLIRIREKLKYEATKKFGVGFKVTKKK